MLSQFMLPTIASGHDIDVTGVARVLMYEQENNTYQLSIVDQQVPAATTPVSASTTTSSSGTSAADGE